MVLLVLLHIHEIRHSIHHEKDSKLLYTDNTETINLTHTDKQNLHMYLLFHHFN